MTQRNQNVRVYRGNSVSLTVGITQADGTAYDPSLEAQFRYRMAKTSHASDAETLIRKSLGDGIENVEGGVRITVDAAETNLEPGIYYHELRVGDVGDVFTVMVGAFIIKQALQMGDRFAPLKGDIQLSGSVPTIG